MAGFSIKKLRLAREVQDRLRKGAIPSRSGLAVDVISILSSFSKHLRIELAAALTICTARQGDRMPSPRTLSAWLSSARLRSAPDPRVRGVRRPARPRKTSPSTTGGGPYRPCSSPQRQERGQRGETEAGRDKARSAHRFRSCGWQSRTLSAPHTRVLSGSLLAIGTASRSASELHSA